MIMGGLLKRWVGTARDGQAIGFHSAFGKVAWVLGDSTRLKHEASTLSLACEQARIRIPTPRARNFHVQSSPIVRLCTVCYFRVFLILRCVDVWTPSPMHGWVVGLDWTYSR